MPHAFDLIKKMLQVDTKQRISAHEIMEHKWLADTSTSSAVRDWMLRGCSYWYQRLNIHTLCDFFILWQPLDFKLIDGMRKFSKMDPLQRIAAKIVAIT